MRHIPEIKNTNLLAFTSELLGLMSTDIMGVMFNMYYLYIYSIWYKMFIVGILSIGIFLWNKLKSIDNI